MIYSIGHKNFNCEMINILSNIAEEVIVIANKDFYTELKKKDNIVKKQVPFYIELPKNRILKKITILANFMMSKYCLIKTDYDIEIYMAYENIVFSLMYFFVKKKNIFIVHHNSVDGLNNGINKLLYTFYINKVNHLVLADYIQKGFILNTNVNKDNVYVINHPLSSDLKIDNIFIDKKEIKDDKKLFVSLGIDSDERIIRMLIEIDKELDFFEKNNINVVVRSSYQEYKSKGINVFTGFLPKEEYYYLFHKADACLLLYPTTFKLRFSGSFMNAFQSKKCIIGMDIPLVRYLVKNYPKNCKIVKDIEQLLFELVNMDLKFDLEEYNSFMKRHDTKTIENQLTRIFDNVNSKKLTKKIL